MLPLRCRVRPGNDDLPRVRAAVGQHDAAGVRSRAEDRQLALTADLRRRRAEVLPHRRFRVAGAARPRLQEHRHQSRLHLLRRQLRDARLRISVVHRPERVLRQCRTALPADRCHGHTDRRAWAAFAPRSSPTSVALTSTERRSSSRRDRRRSSDRSSTTTRTCRRSTAPRCSSTACGWWTRAASYGISLATFALGFPAHFDWSWRTLFNRDWEDVVFSQQGGGSHEFRKVKFTFWIGYDF